MSKSKVEPSVCNVRPRERKPQLLRSDDAVAHSNKLVERALRHAGLDEVKRQHADPEMRVGLDLVDNESDRPCNGLHDRHETGAEGVELGGSLTESLESAERLWDVVERPTSHGVWSDQALQRSDDPKARDLGCEFAGVLVAKAGEVFAQRL